MKPAAILFLFMAVTVAWPSPAAALEEGEAARLQEQVQRLEHALVDADLEKDDAMHRAWDPYFEELWGNTPEARQATQTTFDQTGIGGTLRDKIAEVEGRVESAREALRRAEETAPETPSQADTLEVLRARVVLLQARLDGSQSIIEYHRALGAYVHDAVTGWADEWIKQPFYDFTNAIAGPFLEKMVSEVLSEGMSRIVDLAVTKDPSKLNPGIGAGQAAKGWTKLARMTIKSAMDVEMHNLFHSRLNELAAANGYDPIPRPVTSFMFDSYILASVSSSIEKDEGLQKQFADKAYKAALKKILKDNAASWANSEAAKQAEQQFLDELGAEWKRVMAEAHRAGPASASPEAREKLLAAARDRLQRTMESRRGVYSEEIRKRLSDDLAKRLDEYTRDPKALADGLSIIDTADFAVNDIGVPLLTVWMNGAGFEAIVENELAKYHVMDEFVQRKTNSRMTLPLFKEWYPRYVEIARYRDHWDLVVRADSLIVPERPSVPFLVTLRYTVRGVTALSEMKMRWVLHRPQGDPVVWNALTTFADEYDVEKAGAQAERWEWLLTGDEVDAPGAYQVEVTITPNYAPLGGNPIAGPKLQGWTCSREFVYGKPDTNATAARGPDAVPADSLETPPADSTEVAQADSTSSDSTQTAGAIPDSTASDSTQTASGDLDDALHGLENDLGPGLDAASLLAEFEATRSELSLSASHFDTAYRFFQQRLNEGRDAACGELGLAFAYGQASELRDRYAASLTSLEETAALLLIAADLGGTEVDGSRVETALAEATARAAELDGRLLGEMAGELDLFGCDENDLQRTADPVADRSADPDEVDMGGYAGGGIEICGDGIDNDGDNEIDECDAGCCDGKNVQITVSDCGNAADDVFLILVDGAEVGITPKGAAHTVSANLLPGPHQVGVTTIDDGGEPGVADDVGTYAVTVVVNDVETIGGAGCSSLDLGATASFDVSVPGGAAKAERSIPASMLAPIGRVAMREGEGR